MLRLVQFALNDVLHHAQRVVRVKLLADHSAVKQTHLHTGHTHTNKKYIYEKQDIATLSGERHIARM